MPASAPNLQVCVICLPCAYVTYATVPYHLQGRALIDREPSPFSYVLDYLRNGGALPPLPKDDEQLLQRIREEFDYFCFIPNPVDGARTWVEKLKDGDYSAQLMTVRIEPNTVSV